MGSSILWERNGKAHLPKVSNRQNGLMVIKKKGFLIEIPDHHHFWCTSGSLVVLLFRNSKHVFRKRPTPWTCMEPSKLSPLQETNDNPACLRRSSILLRMKHAEGGSHCWESHWSTVTDYFTLIIIWSNFVSSQDNREKSQSEMGRGEGEWCRVMRGGKRKPAGQMCGRMADLEPRGLAAPSHKGWMDASGNLQFLAAIFFHIKKN